MSSNGQKSVLHPTRIDLSVAVRTQLIGLLNATLASTLDLKTQVKQAHWNVKGLNFYQLHLLFDEMAGELEAYVDEFAERVTTLGGLALGTARVAAQASHLPEYPFDILDGKSHITALADRYASYAKHLRDGIAATSDLGDADTSDLYTEVSRGIDMRLWFLEAHLQADGGVIATANGAATAKATTTRTASAKATTTKAAPKTATKATSAKKSKDKTK